MLGEEAKKGNGWKEERELQIWGTLFYLRHHTVQSRKRIFFFLFPSLSLQKGRAETALTENFNYFELYRV